MFGLNILLLFFGALAIRTVQTTSVYLPGLSPVNYCLAKESPSSNCKVEIPVFVNKLTSKISMVAYAYDSLDFCTPMDTSAPAENLGQVVFGERLRRSAYSISFGKQLTCAVLCEKTYTSANKNLYEILRKAMQMDYNHHWVVDNLPVTLCIRNERNELQCTTSIPLGCIGKSENLEHAICKDYKNSAKTPILLNHAQFTIGYHSATDSWTGKTANRIVSVMVEPRSFAHHEGPDCSSTNPLMLPEEMPPSFKIIYTYGVTFEQNQEVKWASRWDYILRSMQDSHIQWPSILNSVILVILLSITVAFILLRTLRRDIARYSQLENSTEVQEESGWKLVHGDVFRPPRWGMLLSVMVGSGSQIFIMTLVTLFFACLGFLSPANRGALMSCALTMYVLSGVVAGYASARIYKLIGGLRWKTNVLLTATFCPGVVFAIFFILNIALWALHSATAVPFGIIVGLVAMWLCVSLPLCFVGAYYGFRKAPIDVPVRTNHIPRQIPISATVSRATFTFLVGGALPFSCVFIQLFLIFNSIWGTQLYFMFGLLFGVFIMLVLVCSELQIVICYQQLCKEDYRWWWHSFYAGAGVSFFIFVYSIYYFVTCLEYKDAISVFLYFGYTSIIVWLACLLVGTVGFFACLLFIRTIYAVVKVE